MDWFEIIFNVIGDLFTSCIVVLSYILSNEYVKNHVGWQGYKRILLLIGLIGIQSRISGFSKELIAELILTISIPAFIGVIMANSDRRSFYIHAIIGAIMAGGDRKSFYREMKKKNLNYTNIILIDYWI